MSNVEIEENHSKRSILIGSPLTISLNGLETEIISRANTTPNQYGIIAGQVKLNFAEIASSVRHISSILQTHYGVKPGVVIGLFLPRSQWIPLAMAAILKAGGAFVVFDPTAPEARLSYMLQDSEVKLLLVTNETKFQVPKSASIIVDIVRLTQQKVDDLSLTSNIDPNELAYIVYTSGSTGEPKGVSIQRHAVTNLIYALEQILYKPLGNQVRELLSASFIFDAAIQQCLSCLITGNEIHIVNDIIRSDPALFLKYIRDHDIEIINVVTPFLLALIDRGLAEDPPPSLKHIVTGGEAVHPALIERLYAHKASSHLTVTNMYGPAENCTDSTYFPITSKFTSVEGKVPIGYPLPNTRVYVLNEKQEPVLPNTIGDIYVAGAGLAKGYLNQPELTKRSFLADPLYPNERVYRTGDLGYISPEGWLLFVGRSDEQIKIRGYRVELGEISATLLHLTGVKEAAVIAQKNKMDTALVAFIATDDEVDSKMARTFLTERLPDYMIPNQIRVLDRLPHNQNGKIDLKVLETMILEQQSTTKIVPPTNKIESIVLEIWQEVLGTQVQSITDDFFLLGGHSLKAAQITGRIHKHLSINLSIADIYNRRCVREIAVLIQEKKTTPLNLIPQVEDRPDYPLSHAQKRLWLLCQMEAGSKAYNVPLVWDVSSVDILRLAEALTLIVHRHEALRTGFMTVDGEPKQFILSPEEISIFPTVHDLTGASDAIIQAETLTTCEANITFQLEAPPLLRLVVLKLPGNTWRLLLTFHHLVIDGWSLMILFDEINQAYKQLCDGSYPKLPPVLLQYKDYAVWHTKQNYEPSIAYWLKQLANVPPELTLPIDSEDETKQFHGSTVQRIISASLVKDLEELAQNYGITLASLILSLFLLLLFKLTKQFDICVGMGAAGRTHPQLERLVGLMVNILPIRVQITDSMTFALLAGTIAQITAEALNHQAAPLDEIIRQLNPSRRPDRQPLFNVLFAFQSFEEVMPTNQTDSLLDSRQLEQIFFDTAKFDLTLFVNQRDENLLLSLEYRTSCLRSQTCHRLLNMLEQLANHVVLQEKQ
ncbi:amino acid adenylation domain-containing protein [Waterburya agarophytonicola K14]|uniref:Amino acid adenylation domain-containing protein n=1 Tax=Waterburya agarophytonicola KI4 TaxID=2874699 RepID=A0A964BVH5_9CYAN|nr:non-ribosomal peptide synthetase [Waterburya agarophytonicola]MCC0178535.1 amino acid adenylation domain-containing protein [Waterburya agarophytonicola KI4]